MGTQIGDTFLLVGGPADGRVGKYSGGDWIIVNEFRSRYPGKWYPDTDGSEDLLYHYYSINDHYTATFDRTEKF